MTDYGPLDASVAAIRPANPKIAACFDQVEAILKTVAPPDVTPPPVGPVFPGWDTLPPFTPTQTIPVVTNAGLIAALHSPISGALYDARSLAVAPQRLVGSGRPDKLTRILTGPLMGPQTKQPDPVLAAALTFAAGRNLQVIAYGGVSAPWGTGVTWQGYGGVDCTDCSFWALGGIAHTGLGSFGMHGNAGPVVRPELRGDLTAWGIQPSLDPHGDGTGVHGCYLGASGGVPCQDVTAVVRVHDCAIGNGVQLTHLAGAKLYVEGANLTGEPTAHGTAGNLFDPFAAPDSSTGVVIPYAVAANVRKMLNLTGGGIGPSGDLRFEYGRGTGIRTPPAYDTAPGVTLVDCKP